MALIDEHTEDMERAMAGLKIDYTSIHEAEKLIADWDEQYRDAVERAKEALVEDNIEMALKCIRAAQYVKYRKGE